MWPTIILQKTAKTHTKRSQPSLVGLNGSCAMKRTTNQHNSLCRVINFFSHYF